MTEYIVTFGFDHINPITGKTLANNYVRVPALDYDEARDKISGRFGDKWSMIYTSEIEAGVRRFNLQELEFSW